MTREFQAPLTTSQLVKNGQLLPRTTRIEKPMINSLLYFGKSLRLPLPPLLLLLLFVFLLFLFLLFLSLPLHFLTLFFFQLFRLFHCYCSLFNFIDPLICFLILLLSLVIEFLIEIIVFFSLKIFHLILLYICYFFAVISFYFLFVWSILVIAHWSIFPWLLENLC